MKKRLLSLLLVIALLCTMLPAFSMKAEATYIYNWITERGKVDGSNYTKSTALAQKLNQIFDGNANIYYDWNCTQLVGTRIGTSNVKNDGVYKYVGPYGGAPINSGTSCWIYANGVYYTLFGECTGNGEAGPNSESLNIWNTSSTVLTYNNFKSWGVRQGVGALIRANGHSMIVLGYDKNYLTILDGNGDEKGLVSVKVCTWSQVSFTASYIIQPEETYFYAIYPECEHTYDNVGYCSKCKTDYNWQVTLNSSCAGTYKVTKSEGIYLRTEKPYTADDAKSENKIPYGTKVQVLGSVTNHYPNKWYKVSYNGIVGYCYEEHLELVPQPSVQYVTITQGDYYLRNNSTGKYLAVDGGVDASQQNISVAEFTGGNEMKLAISAATQGYIIRPHCATRIVNPYGDVVVPGLNVSLLGNVSDSSQWWGFEKVSGGYIIRNMQNQNCVLSVNGTNVVIAEYKGSPEQIWSLETKPAQNMPTGVVESVVGGSLKISVGGWVYDKDDVTRNVRVQMYVDSTYVGEWVANGHRPDVNSNSAHLGVGEYHGYYFSYKTPASMVGKHTVYIYAIDEETGTTKKLTSGFPIEVYACTHSYTSKVTTAATCTAKGVKTYTCSNCGDSYTESIAATGHSYGSWVTTTAAGCTTTGTKKKTCSSCGNVQTQSIAATGHNYQSQNIGATCKDYEKICYTCSKCQHSYEEYTAEAYSEWSTTKPTGVDASLIETKTQYSYRTISYTTEYSSWSAWSDWSTTRQSTSDLKKEESRTVWGYYYFKCPGCGAYMHGWGMTCLSWAGGCGQTYIPEGSFVEVYSTTSWDSAGLKDWHGTGKYYTYIDGELVFKWTEGGTSTQYRYATRTSKQVANYSVWSSWSDTVYTESSTREVKTQTLYRYVQRQLGDHTWDSGKITTQATCTANGTKTYTCTSCGTTKKEILKATGHNLKEYTEQATCTQEGKYGYVCTNCDYAEEAGTIPATGHGYGEWKTVTAAGCTTVGTQEKTCTSCGDVLVQSIAATGHSYGDWVTTTAAGCTTPGAQEKTCASCGNVQTQSIVATGHNYVSGCCTSCGSKDPNTATASGTCGKNVKWVLDAEGVLTISGTGAMYDWGYLAGDSAGTCPWKNVKSSIKSVIIEHGVTTIGNCAFEDCFSLTSVTVPDSVTSIGSCAFSYCENLTSVTIPGSVATIGDFAFSSCYSLTSVTIPDSVTSIGCSAFFFCSGLTTVTMSASVKEIGDEAFCDCVSLKTVYYGGSTSQWASIDIRNDNDYLLNATIHYGKADGVVGDFTGDEIITNDDVIILLWHCLFPEENPVAAKGDFTGDGMVTNEDVIKLLWHCLFPEQNPL